MDTQLLVKGIITSIYVFFSFFVLKYVWCSDIDFKKTLERNIFRMNPINSINDLLEIRDQLSLYRDGIKVGDVIEPNVDVKNGIIFFKEINYDNSRINLENVYDPFIFRFYEIKIENFESIVLQYPPKIFNVKARILREGV